MEAIVQHPFADITFELHVAFSGTPLMDQVIFLCSNLDPVEQTF